MSERLRQPTREAKSETFNIEDKEFDIKWTSIDFKRDGVFKNAPKQYRSCGVLYNKDAEKEEEKVIVSSEVSEKNQALSALHEHLCMGVEGSVCHEVESIVIGSIDNEADRENYIIFRIKMFKVLCNDCPDVKSFAETLAYLESL